MALTARTKDILTVALADRRASAELAAACDAGANHTAAVIAAIGSTTNIPAASIALSTSNTYTDSAVKTAVDAGINGVRTATESRLDVIEAKVDALIAALKTAGLMATS